VLALVFELGGESYAVPARRVREVVRRPVTRAVAGAPEWIAGLFSYGNVWVPVIDLCRLVSRTPCPEGAASRVALVDHTRGKLTRTLGLLAPGMTRVLDLAPGRSEGLHTPGHDFLGAIVRNDEYGIQLVDVDRVLPPELDKMLFGREPK
jgi:chemotaxis-related protein WspB